MTGRSRVWTTTNGPEEIVDAGQRSEPPPAAHWVERLPHNAKASQGAVQHTRNQCDGRQACGVRAPCAWRLIVISGVTMIGYL